MIYIFNFIALLAFLESINVSINSISAFKSHSHRCRFGTIKITEYGPISIEYTDRFSYLNSSFFYGITITYIISLSAPFKINSGVVCRITVYMINSIIFIWVLYKSLCNKPVDTDCIISPVLTKGHIPVATFFIHTLL